MQWRGQEARYTTTRLAASYPPINVFEQLQKIHNRERYIEVVELPLHTCATMTHSHRSVGGADPRSSIWCLGSAHASTSGSTLGAAEVQLQSFSMLEKAFFDL